MKVSTKELRETYNSLRLINKKKWLPEKTILPSIDENNQLISIFVKSIETAQKNDAKSKKKPPDKNE
jgi:hypothetical protein